MAAAAQNNFINRYLGPSIPVGIDRKIYPYTSYLAPSYVPNSLLPPFDPQSAIFKKNVEDITTKHKVTFQLLKSIREDLKNHIEGRVGIFIQQMFLLYKTGVLINLYTKADIQVGAVPSNVESCDVYVGAHCSTLPTLRIDTGQLCDSSVSLGMGTSFFYNWNTTIYLPEIANKIDCKIDSSFRMDALKILNKVSQGNICPQNGLILFLEKFIKTTKELIISQEIVNDHEEKDNIDSPEEILTPEQKKIKNQNYILEQYINCAENYLESLQNGYPILQKLFLKPIDTKINEDFFKNIQSQMHEEFFRQLPQEQNIEALIPEDLDLFSFLQYFDDHIDFIKEQSQTVSTYAKHSSDDPQVQISVIDYLNYLKTLDKILIQEELNNLATDPSSRKKDLNQLQKKLIEKIQKALNCIQSNPQQIHRIAISTLVSSCKKLLTKQKLDVVLKDGKKDLLKLLESKTATKHSDTIELYTQTCLKDPLNKVVIAARDFFREIENFSPKLKEFEIDKFFKISKSTIGIYDLSKNAIRLYESVLETIEKSFSVSNPRNIGIVICSTILNLEKS